ncbi:MAG: coenzyme F420-0:L-glutamate ligase [Roseomonas sp.]|nr:coenzyme F420-0:L-glutamate ligase [Roseomonas sp.]MCA3428168.1 coenzyme F420-0:L-glutamate ligase [Roseomonas sp.]MCA3433692.1 coenzyme F420-0:L-glutamate ligase [Roseomonas sp.]
MKAALQLFALPGLPMVQAGDDLAGLLSAAMARAGLAPQQGDVLAVAQKIVSKAEGRSIALASVQPSVTAHELAEQTGKDARLVELILSESEYVVRARPNLIIVKHRLGFVMANAGIDQSNIGADGHALLLPRDPDGSAAALAARLGLPVVITDSFGRAWRRGTVGVAIGAAGLPALCDLRGQPDLFGRTLMVSITGFADEIAAAAGLVMGQGAEGQPAVLVRGLSWSGAANPAAELLRPAQEDLFP